MEPVGEQMTLFSLAGSHDHASHFQSQETNSEQRMNATSGRRCLEQLEKLNPGGLFQKTFVGLLVGMEGWFSSRCALTWKVKATKSSRLYCQLAVSTLHTKDTGLGFWPTPMQPGNGGTHGKQKLKEMLLPTPRAQENDQGPKARAGMIEAGSSWLGQNRGATVTTMAKAGLLPTPRASMNENRQTKLTPSQMEGKHGLSLAAVVNTLLPTPMASDCGNKVTGLENQDSLVKRAREMTGVTSQLNPRFVAEMMGFPPDWLELPFQNTEMKV